MPQRESLGVKDTPTDGTCQIQVEAIAYKINKVVLNLGTTKKTELLKILPPTVRHDPVRTTGIQPDLGSELRAC